MTNSWWMLWMAFMFIFLLSPVGYGWGYRRWGPPYPRYLQRRRGERAVAAGGTAAFHHSWGMAGDVVWIVFFVSVLWAVTALWLPVWRQ